MTILGIETSCDETAVSVVRGAGGFKRPRFDVLAHVVSSQTAIHAPWGGVVPMLAKREHSKNLIPVLKQALEKSSLIKGSTLKTKNLKVEPWGLKNKKKIERILAWEPELLEQFLKFIPTIAAPKIDAIAVTSGPGLEPALWTGINFAKALATVWRKPLIPINHLEGHIVSVLTPQGLSAKKQTKVRPLVPQGLTLKLKFPALALIISGGHTELVLIRDWFKYRIIGQTRDDAVGEAFDKVARLLGLPYPGGPALAALADKGQKSAKGLSLGQVLKDSPLAPLIKLPRPMIDSPDLDFSFSGLKTAVLYLIKKIPRVVLDKRSDLKGTQGPTLGGAIAVEFQQAVIDVLIRKTTRAFELYQPRTVIVTGGVSANQELKRQMAKSIDQLETPPVLLIPPPALATDNATMIAMAGYLRHFQGSPLRPRLKGDPLIQAHGRLVLK